MDIITLKQERLQTISVTLGEQNITLRLYQMPSNMYIDILKDNVAIALGVPCLPFTRLIRYNYTDFEGDLVFIDYTAKTGAIDEVKLPGRVIETSLPNYSQLGDKYALYYISPSD